MMTKAHIQLPNVYSLGNHNPLSILTYLSYFGCNSKIKSNVLESRYKMNVFQAISHLVFTYFLVFARFESIFPRKSSIDFLLSSSGLSISFTLVLIVGLCDAFDSARREDPAKARKFDSSELNGNDIDFVNWLCWSDVSRSTGIIKYCRRKRLSWANKRLTRRICSVCRQR